MRRILILAALLVATAVRGQRLDPQEYAYPIRDVPGLCAANFGEMRPGHFHAGVDIKTDGAEGKPLVAVADGYVSRVTISAGGYGRALYVTLRNGKTAVYGHLQRFRNDIETHVCEERCRRRSNNIDLSFDASQWPVRRGEVVGYSGNSGSSMGPHLHFELRDTQTDLRYNLVRERVIRPEDDMPPRIMRVHYVEVDTVRGVPVHGRPESYAVVRGADGRYRLTREEPVPVGPKGYFVFEASDRRNGVHNTFGLWRVTASVDGEPSFEYRMDGFTYAQARLCDAVSYYPLQLTSRNEVFRLAQLAGAPDCFYPVMTDRGVVRTAPGQRRRIRIEAEDDSGNSSSIEFAVSGRERSSLTAACKRVAESGIVLRHDRPGVVSVGDSLTAYVPAGALFEPIVCRPARLEKDASGVGVVVLSPVYRVFDASTPLAKAAKISIRARIPQSLRLRSVVARRRADGTLSCVGGHYADGGVTVETRTTGDLLVVADTVPPVIRPLFTAEKELARDEALRFRASDNFSGIVAWSLRIDDRWVPCDRFPMRGTLVHTFDTPARHEKHRVVLTVTDACGNTGRWEGTFRR